MNTKYIELASAYAIQYNYQSNDNKAEFTKVWDMVKTIPKPERVAELKLMKKASETIKLNSARREYGKLLTMCTNYAMLPDRYVSMSNVSFENLTRVLGLVNRVNKHYEGDMTKLEGISKVYEYGMSGYRYNNGLEAKCKALAEALPAIIDTKAITEEQALLYLDKVSITTKRAMLARLMADLHIEEEVAA